MNILLQALRLHFNTVGRIAPRPAGALAMKLFSTPRFKPSIKAEYQSAVNAAENIEIEVDGHRLKGYYWDNGGDKLALLLHGWESRAARMSVLLPVLQEFGYNAIAFDAPAHGDSSGSQIHVPMYGGVVAKLAEKYQPAVIFGHSMGALAAVYAVTHLQAAQSAHKLVLIAAATDPEWMMHNAINMLRLPSPVVKTFQTEITRLTGLPIEHFTMHKLVARHQPQPQALFLHAPDDTIALMEGVEQAAKAWGEHAKLVVLPNKGHSRIVGSKQTQAAIRAFLST